MTRTAAKKPDLIGRLTSFGLSAPWQVPLLLPSGWDDLTRPLERFDHPVLEGDSYVVVGRLEGTPSIKFGQGAPRLTGYLSDPNGRKISFSAFGDTREFQANLKEYAERVALLGQMDSFNDRLWLKNPEIVPLGWLGRFRPRYPGKTGVIGPNLVRDRVLQHLKWAVPIAAQFLAQELKEFGNPGKLAELAGLPGWPLEVILLQAHVPRSVEHGLRAQRALEYLAALGVIQAAKGKQASAPLPMGPAFSAGDWRRRAKAIPFALTDEQQQAIGEIVADLSFQAPMRRILTGDVGTGKTAVYGTVCASVADGQGRGVVLLPSFGLADQVSREFRQWWPDLRIQVVTNETGALDPQASILVGTTALLHRKLPWKVDLMVVDEQQKFSREQRENLVAADTNLLEVTATCIPRSMALVRYGVTLVSKLTQCHARKNIRTQIWHRNQWQQLFNETMQTLRAGGQLLLVYPLREKDESGEEGEGRRTEEDRNKQGPQRELRSAAEVFEIWSRKFPGKARLLHGQMSDSDKQEVLADLREARADILISTTVVEVGVTLPSLRRVIIVHPERHGLTTLHQIRGRLARHGGDGWCDLFLPYPVKEKTMERLHALERTTDGFEIAEFDMRLRGVGDLSRDSSKQSGSDDTFLFGRPVRMDLLDEVMQRIIRTPPRGR